MFNIYNIMLNFNSNLIYFYEWSNRDSIKNYKKVYLFRVSEIVLNDILNNDIEINGIFKNVISNKIVIFTDLNNIIALDFKDNKTYKRSDILLDEQFELINLAFSLKEIILDYKIIKNINTESKFRDEELIKNKIIKCINDIKEKGMIKYINYELFNINSDSKEKLINKINSNNYLNNKKIYNQLFELLSII